jgi:hypothetical protein
MNALADGRYDVFILDTEILDADTIRVELVLVSGDAKGDVVALRGPHIAPDVIALIGLPATLVVANGVPRIELEHA